MTGWWFSPGTSMSSTNTTDCHSIAEILLKILTAATWQGVVEHIFRVFLRHFSFSRFINDYAIQHILIEDPI